MPRLHQQPSARSTSTPDLTLAQPQPASQPLLRSHADVLALQRSAGNRAVQQLLGAAQQLIHRDVIQRAGGAKTPTQKTHNTMAVVAPYYFFTRTVGSNWEKVRSMYALPDDHPEKLFYSTSAGPSGNGPIAYNRDQAKTEYAGMNGMLALRLRETLLKTDDGASWSDGFMSPMQKVKNQKLASSTLNWNYGAGTDSPTSDIDSNLSGANTEEAVGFFNEEFRRFWGKESGTVFDVNVYARDYLASEGNLFGAAKAIKGGGSVSRDGNKLDKRHFTPAEFSGLSFQAASGGGSPSAPVTAGFETSFASQTSEAYTQAMGNEEVYSLVKLRMDMSSADWERYKTDQLAQSPKLQDTLTRVEAIYTQRQAEIDKKVKAYLTKLGLTLQTEEELRHLPESARNRQEEQLKDLHMRAENELYAEKLKAVSTKRAQLAEQVNIVRERQRSGSPSSTEVALPDLEALYVQLNEKLYEASVYANEAYVTGASVRHVVANKQMMSNKSKAPLRKDAKQKNLKIALTIDEYMHSATEQMGFIFKELNLYSSSVTKAVLKSAKYMHRLTNAAKHIYRDLNAPVDEHLQLFENLSKYALAQKLGGGQAEEAERLAASKDPAERAKVDVGAVTQGGAEWRALGAKSVDDVKTMVLTLSKNLSGLYYTYKQAQATPMPTSTPTSTPTSS